MEAKDNMVETLFWLEIADKNTSLPIRSAAREIFRHPQTQIRVCVRGKAGLTGDMPGVMRPSSSIVLLARPGLRVELHAGASPRISIAVGITSADLLFLRKGAGRLTLSTDLRDLCGPSDRLSPAAIFSVLQYGAVPPPLALYEGVEALLPGGEYEIPLETLTPRLAAVRKFPGTQPPGPPAERAAGNACDALKRTLDEALDRLCGRRRPVIMFSGGVDSGLLAALVAARGERNALLVNYSFGPGDAEAEVARQMAGTLGLEFHQITARRKLDLQAAVATMVQPFADHSIMPSVDLAQHILELPGLDGVVLDGTGADGAFGLFRRVGAMQRLYQVPRPLRQLAGALYRATGLWRREGRIERVLRLMRRSAQMPIEQFAVAQNPLHGIGFHFSREVVADANTAFQTWIDGAVPADALLRVPAADLMLTCTRIFAQKAKGVYDSAGVEAVYPYLDAALLRFAFERRVELAVDAEPKALLKELLCKSVPREMIYRPKSGFVAPRTELFADDEVVSSVERLARGASLISEYLDAPCLCRVLELLKGRKPLSPQTHSFVWAAVVIDVWLRSRR
jgi:asparagine synthase (glutamine-hydrolysing)